MPDERPQPSEDFRVFLDGDAVPKGDLTMAFGQRIGCTLDGREVKLLEVVYESSGEIDEMGAV